jgi:hypothetical protein
MESLRYGMPLLMTVKVCAVQRPTVSLPLAPT